MGKITLINDNELRSQGCKDYNRDVAKENTNITKESDFFVHD